MIINNTQALRSERVHLAETERIQRSSGPLRFKPYRESVFIISSERLISERIPKQSVFIEAFLKKASTNKLDSGLNKLCFRTCSSKMIKTERIPISSVFLV